MATIRDIAKRADVSVSTASLALNGDARVTPVTRQRVLEAARMLNYHPSRAARGLSKGRTYSLHLFNPIGNDGLSSSFFTRFAKGVHDVVHSQNYSLALTVLDDEDEARDILERLILEKWTDGVILMNLSQETRLLEQLAERTFPHVLLGSSAVAGVQSVDNDNEAVAYEATQHLLARGGDPVLFLNGLAHHRFVQERATGFKAAHQAWGLVPDTRHLQFDLTQAADARARVDALLSEGLAFNSVLASSDVLAVGALRALRDHRLRVPQDVRLIGINNDDITDYTDPPLSSVELHASQLGREAARLLLESIAGAPFTRQLVPHRLVLRDSS